MTVNCIQSAEAGIADPAYDIAPKQENKVFEEGSYEPDVDRLFERTKELMATIKERHPKYQGLPFPVNKAIFHSVSA